MQDVFNQRRLAVEPTWTEVFQSEIKNVFEGAYRPVLFFTSTCKILTVDLRLHLDFEVSKLHVRKYVFGKAKF